MNTGCLHFAHNPLSLSHWPWLPLRMVSTCQKHRASRPLQRWPRSTRTGNRNLYSTEMLSHEQFASVHGTMAEVTLKGEVLSAADEAFVRLSPPDWLTTGLIT